MRIGFVSLVVLASCAVACGGGAGVETFTGELDSSAKHHVSGSSSGSSAADDGSGSTTDDGSVSGDDAAADGGDDGGVAADDGGTDADDGGAASDASGDDASGADATTDGASGGGLDASDAGDSTTGGDAGDATTGGSSGGGGTDAGDSGGGSSGGRDTGAPDTGTEIDDAGGASDGSGATDATVSGHDSGAAADAGSAAHDASADSSTGVADAGKDAAATCNLTGAWALKITATVSWGATGLVYSGTNQTVYLWALMQESQSGDTITTTVLPCGLTLPDFSSPFGQYGVTVPDAIFDGTDLTASPTTMTVSSSTPGATLTGPATANLIGLTLASPATAAWPSLTTAEATEVDMDQDGYPGITTTVKTGGAYSPIPTTLDLFDITFADQLYMTLRSVIALSGTLTTCTQVAGTATVSHLDNHIVGCHIYGEPQGDAGVDHCDSNQASFVDDNSPALVASSASFVSVLLTDVASCPSVHLALP